MGQPRVGEEPQYKRNKEATVYRERETNRHNAVINSITAVHAVISRIADVQITRRDQTERHEQSRRKRENRTVAALAVTAIVGAVGIGLAHCDTEKAIQEAQNTATQQHADTVAALGALQTQATTMQGQLNEMRAAANQTNQAIAATNRLADEAKRQADLARDNLVWSRRLWVDFADGVQIDKPLTINGDGQITLSIKTAGKNSGNSPALNVWLENILHVGVPLGGYTRDLVDQYICPARPSPVPGSFTSQLIMPNATIPLWPGTGSTRADKPKVTNTKYLMAWTSVCLRYDDEFGISHETGQLFWYVGTPPSPLIDPDIVGVIGGRLQALTSEVLK
jgi:hypothetical protein